MNNISNRLLSYRAFLSSEKQRLENEIRLLEEENRRDEADLMKIRLNIYGVFETVAAADEKVCTGWEDFCLRYEPRFDTLTAPWKARLASAVRNSDTRTRFAEEAKLGTANRIHNAFIVAKEQHA